MNLLMNAFDAAGNSGGDGRVVLGTREGATEVEVYVHNSGAALSREVQARLFDAFYSTKPHGLGMGLAIVRIIVERHQGVVRGANHPDGGVVFSVVMPKG
jgi:two-component system, LuxR family, sensor histidine kinase TtrS